MLSKKVIATQITNLTDARYFAARGVDFLLFECGKITSDKILEISEWVAGPEILLVFDQSSIAQLDELVIKLSPYAIAVNDTSLTASTDHLQAHINFFSMTSGQIILDDQVFVLVDSVEDLKELADDSGLIAQGSSENEIGIKNYDQLDEIFDILEIQE